MKSLKKKNSKIPIINSTNETLYTKFSRSKFRKINHPRFLFPSLEKKKRNSSNSAKKNRFSDRIEDSGMGEKRRDGGANMAATAVGTWRASHDGQTSSSNPDIREFLLSPLRRVYIGFEESAAVSTVTARWNIARDNNKQTHSNEPRFY